MPGYDRISVIKRALADGVNAASVVADTNRLVNSRIAVRGALSPVTRDLIARRSPIALEIRPTIEATEVRRSLDRMATWHNDAMLKLHDLASTRATLEDRGTLTPELRTRLGRGGHRLIASMSRNAEGIASLEASRGRWHVAAHWARQAIGLRGDVAKTTLGRALRPSVGGHLALAHATFMLEGNSPRLRRDLRNAATANPRSSSLAYWSARYDLLVGNYRGAFSTIKDAAGGRMRELLSIVSPDTKAPPWVPYPCNFYTYRYALVDDDTIRMMQQELTVKASTGTPSEQQKAALGLLALQALLFWNQANRDMQHEKYGSAASNYSACQRAVLTYFAAHFPGQFSVPDNEDGVYSELVRLARTMIRYGPGTRPVWYYFRERYAAITLEELHEIDWVRPTVAPSQYRLYQNSANLLRAMLELPAKIDEKLNAPMLALALIFAPLGMAEANRLRRNFDDALRLCREILRRHDDVKILCEFIEKPFVKILFAQILLEKGDAEYKARLQANSPALNADGSPKYQGLAAAETYAGVLMAFEDQGQYVARVESGLASLRTSTQTILQKAIHPFVALEPSVGMATMTADDRFELASIGKRIPIETVQSRQESFPGLERLIGAHESIITFAPPAGEESLRESNPLVYAIIAQARARLLQLEAGLNFLGYSDDYVPPWRFQFLLIRARYFAEHAKNAENEYLNFLQNAEREEFQELSVAQNVVLEKSNVRIENSRVEQARLQLEAAKQSVELAKVTAENAAKRAARFQEFDERADELSKDVISSSGLSMAGAAGTGALGGAVAGAIVGSAIPGIGTAIGAVGGAIIGGLSGLFSSAGADKSQGAQLAVADEQRGFELESLQLAAQEAVVASSVAQAQADVAESMVTVAAMQRASALLRHEFAVQSLAFLRNRTLNSELWYRLAHLIRGVSETYLRYAIELSFLAEQSYEFEVDKRVNVIRFDYDVSEIGSMLAADFLLADLDTLEQDLLVNERTRQQPLRYVISLAREFPESLRELRETGSTIFTIPLEAIERRIPGFYGVRIGSLELLPLALMDRTRFGIELTHLGASQIRLRAMPDSPRTAPPIHPLNLPDIASWLPSVDTDYPVKIRVHGPETAFFSGLSASTTTTDPAFSFIANAQRGAFEHRGAAGSWRIDMSMADNKVVPGSLTDFLVSFNLYGYHDPALRDAIDRAPRRSAITTQWLSARTYFPDAFYRLQQTGRMEWDVRQGLSPLGSRIGTLRNAGVMLIPTTRRPSFGRVLTSHTVVFDVGGGGTVSAVNDIPAVTLTPSGLHLDAAVALAAGDTAHWSFDDGATFQTGGSVDHDYRRPGSYEIVLRVEHEQRLSEHRIALAISDATAFAGPLLVRPSVQTGAGDGTPVPPGLTRIIASVDPDVPDTSTIWKIVGRLSAAGATVQFDLAPGRYVLSMSTVRSLRARLFNQQRYLPSQSIDVIGLNAVSNRTFAADGTETTGAPNGVATHLFGAGALVPDDIWTLELPLADNPALRSLSRAGAEEVYLREIQDVCLIAEYEAG